MKAFRIENNTLFVKMFILLFLSVLIPVTFLGYWYFNRASGQIEQVTSGLLTENLQQNRLRLEQYFKQAELHSESIIASQKLEVLDTALEDRLFLSRSLSLINDLKGRYDLAIYPADETRYAAYSALLRSGPLLSGPERIRQALELEGRGYWYAEGGSFVFVRLIRAMSDLRPLAVIQLSMSGFQVSQQLIAPFEYPNFRHDIADENGNVLLASPRGEMTPGEKMFLSDIPLTGVPWTLVAAIPEKDLIGPVENIRRVSLLLALASIGLISILLALVTNSFISPIKYVVAQMKKAQLGQLVPSDKYADRRDEIGQLTRGYNSLIYGMEELLETTKQMEADKSRTEMQMLIHQINPHFLYNTLDAIKWRADHVREQTIAEMVTSLSNLIRYSINNGEEFTTVEREIEHVKSYLSIESLRSPDTFQVVVSVQPRALNVPILKLIIQPLVENSVRHGMNKLQSGRGKILIRVFIEGEDLVCIVEDNGPGCSEEASARMNRPNLQPGETGGVGLYNVNQRLKIRFGMKYGVTLENREHGGCKATIRHPLM
ncbi:sensor histidine kinase [Paenibacillus hamazuiensis]|uniref:sensor histidine kinase n=1 Tax=Paenibacillus hamazuiensis TaxID=2936508 RepID=UPI00200F1E77|nr:sensor histidine kinase [Paenibacillus hamazuiensis]